MKAKRKPRTAQQKWARYSRDRSFYFVYPVDRPNTWKLIDTGKYGVVQLPCIVRAVRQAFMAGHRAGRRSRDNGNGNGS